MAGDWIKMRVWISRDPRVIWMADHLANDKSFMAWLSDPVQQSCRNSAYDHVTRNVTVALCVTALLVTWGTAREQGDRDGDDLILDHCDLETLDAITDLPGFGAAMSLVGWAEETENGGVLFPKFFKENESPDEKHKRQAAERQARKREKDRQSNVTSNVTDNVTITPREEKRREVIPSVAHDKIVFDGSSFQNINGQMAVWGKAFPAVDVSGEINKAAAWLMANPKNRKSNYDRFLTNWLSRAQDRAPASGGGLASPTTPNIPGLLRVQS